VFLGIKVEIDGSDFKPVVSSFKEFLSMAGSTLRSELKKREARAITFYGIFKHKRSALDSFNDGDPAVMLSIAQLLMGKPFDLKRGALWHSSLNGTESSSSQEPSPSPEVDEIKNLEPK